MCSIAVAALALAAFLPAVVGCCAWVKSLAVAGGVFMFGYVVFQLAAAVLVYFFVEVSEKIGESNNQYQYILWYSNACWPSTRKVFHAMVSKAAVYLMFMTPHDPGHSVETL